MKPKQIFDVSRFLAGKSVLFCEKYHRAMEHELGVVALLHADSMENEINQELRRNPKVTIGCTAAVPKLFVFVHPSLCYLLT